MKNLIKSDSSNTVLSGPFFGYAFLLFIIFAVTTIPVKGHCLDLESVDFKPEVSVSEAYDDNITYAEDNEKKDWITEISSSIKAVYENEMNLVEFTGGLTHQIFAQNHDFDNTSETLKFNLEKELSRYARINIKDDFSHTYEAESIAAEFGRVTGRYSYYVNKLLFKYERDLAEELAMSAVYINEINLFSKSDTADSHSNTIELQMNYALNSTSTAILIYSLSNREFDPGKDATKNSFSAGFRQKLTGKLELNALTGVEFISAYNGTDYIKPKVNISLVNEFNERSKADISFVSEHGTTAYLEDIFKLWQVSSSYSSEIMRNIYFSASLFYGKGQYLVLDAEDILMGGEVSFGFDIRKNLKLDIGYDYSKVDSTVDSREYDKNRVFGKVKLEF